MESIMNEVFELFFNVYENFIKPRLEKPEPKPPKVSIPVAEPNIKNGIYYEGQYKKVYYGYHTEENDVILNTMLIPYDEETLTKDSRAIGIETPKPRKRVNIVTEDLLSENITKVIREMVKKAGKNES